MTKEEFTVAIQLDTDILEAESMIEIVEDLQRMSKLPRKCAIVLIGYEGDKAVSLPIKVDVSDHLERFLSKVRRDFELKKKRLEKEFEAL